MNIEEELNKRLTKKGIYSNHYSLKETLNHFTGYIFLSEKWIWTYIIDKIAYDKNDKVYTKNDYIDYSSMILEKYRENYMHKIDRLATMSRRLYSYSGLFVFISLGFYFISFGVFNKWIWLEQTGIGLNLFILTTVLGILFMSLSFLFLPIKEFSIKRHQNIISVSNTLLAKETTFIKADEKTNSAYNSFFNFIHHLHLTKKVDLDNRLLSITRQSQIQDSFDIPISQKNVTRLIRLMLDNQHMTLLNLVELQDISDIIIERFTQKGKRFKKKSFGNALSDTLITSKCDFEKDIQTNRELAQLMKADQFSFISQSPANIG